METPVRLGIIGLGAMGAEVLSVASAHPAFEVVAAADPEVARHQDGYPSVRFTTDSADVRDGLDAVYIATPPAFHADLAVAALQAGLSVLCEKPLAIDLADGRRMVAAADAAPGVAAVNFALSDRHATVQLEDALGFGLIGEVLSVEIRLAFTHWPRDFQAHAGWLDGRAQGGFVREVLSHFVYLTDRLLGPLEPVDLHLDHGADFRSEIAAWGLLRAGGVPVQVSAVAGAAGQDSYEWIIRGTKRSYLLRDWDQLFVADSNGWKPVRLVGARGSEETRLSLFAEAMHGRSSGNLADFATGFRVQQVVEAFHQA
ncbi:Gfo/Idh/MocA family oxidoreductase [Kribbella antibiotica]|uniref:Gfo/Idh/MocA family oxidoreductase n=1 Tax=Kribbella antibiotica TaxID=190195 RepID=A0A4R4ZLL6_9ACTN|nr:Gfo/Idh/MocA family oxidoreductase [Kribbella antibiotica]TDD57712.1 Gfo/Idh/MocA family oxidoreductase [Kribbella antibiotica]